MFWISFCEKRIGKFSLVGKNLLKDRERIDGKRMYKITESSEKFFAKNVNFWIFLTENFPFLLFILKLFFLELLRDKGCWLFLKQINMWHEKCIKISSCLSIEEFQKSFLTMIRLQGESMVLIKNRTMLFFIKSDRNWQKQNREH